MRNMKGLMVIMLAAVMVIGGNLALAKEEASLKSIVKKIEPQDKLITQADEVTVSKGSAKEGYTVKLKDVGKNSIIIDLDMGGGKKVKVLRRILKLPNFKDVLEGYWAKKHIELVVAADLINKGKSSYFRPDSTQTREKFARTLVRAVGIKPVSVLEDVSADVPESSTYAKYINYIVNTRKIMDLDASGNFRPEDKITRGEAIVALCKFERISEDWEMVKSPFEDLPPRHKYAKFISAAKKAGMLDFAEQRGYIDADGLLTEAELAVLITKTKSGKKAIADLLNWEIGYGVNVDEKNVVALSK